MKNVIIAIILIVISFNVHGKEVSFHVIDGSKPVLTYNLGGSTDSENRIALNFSDNTDSDGFFSNKDNIMSMFDHGYHAAETEVIFIMHVIESNRWLYSIAELNYESKNHIFWHFVDGVGLIVGFEDVSKDEQLPNGDYNDAVFLVTNVIPSISVK